MNNGFTSNIIMIQAVCDMGLSSDCDMRRNKNKKKHSKLTIFWVFQIPLCVASSYTYLAELHSRY